MLPTLTYGDALRNDLSAMMDELHDFVSSIQKPRVWDESWSDSVHEYCRKLEEGVDEIRGDLKDRLKAVTESLDEISETISAYSAELAESANKKNLHSLYHSLTCSYEELILKLKRMKHEEGFTPPRTRHLKPTKYARNVFHACMGLSGFFMYEFVLSKGQALFVLLSLFALFASLEIARRRFKGFNDFMVDKLFGLISRPSERYKINGSTYYLFALVVIVLLFPKLSVELAVLILALADPAASVLGTFFGGRKLFRDKSYAGSAVFFAVAFVISFPFMLIMTPGVSVVYSFFAALILASIGTAVELFTIKIDDNFTIPVVCAAVATLLI